MSRRFGSPLYGNQFCGNTDKKEVHDLDKEDAKRFSPDTLAQAHAEGFDNCAKCIGESRR
jgi:hypothetical protein